MNDIGYIKLWRKFRDDGLWQEKRELSKFEAWLDILAEVNFKKKEEIIIGNKVLSCDRGQSIRSLESWQERWNWRSKYKVRAFLKLLEKTNKVTLENKTVTTRLSVCNYKRYQDMENAEKTETKRKKNASKTHTDPIEEDNKKEEENNKNELEKTLDDFYSFRKNIKKPMNDNAKKLLIGKLDKLADNDNDKIQILENSIVSGWQSVYELKKDNKKNFNNENSLSSVEITE